MAPIWKSSILCGFIEKKSHPVFWDVRILGGTETQKAPKRNIWVPCVPWTTYPPYVEGKHEESREW